MAVNPGALRRRARVMRAVNVPMRAVLGLPFRTPLSGNLMLISYTGRKTGKAYRQPVSYAANPLNAPSQRCATATCCLLPAAAGGRSASATGGRSGSGCAAATCRHARNSSAIPRRWNGCLG